jgi:hypothetical protein
MLFNSPLLLAALALYSSVVGGQTTPTQNDTSPTSADASPSPSSDATTKAGWSGTLSSLSGGLQGTVTVMNPTTLLITNYKLADASAPALYWWGSTTSNIKSGFRISNTHITTTSSGMDLQVTLDTGKTVADFSTVGLWCERFDIDFGQATLQPGGSASVATGAPQASSSKTGSGTAVSVPIHVGIMAGVVVAGWLFL